jgi:hypothetical protein
MHPLRCDYRLRVSIRSTDLEVHPCLTIIIGVDFHKAYSQIAVQDRSGKTVRCGRVRNDRRSVESFLAPFSDNAHAVLEACQIGR